MSDATLMSDATALTLTPTPTTLTTPPAAPLRILMRRGALLVVDKPGGMLVHNSAWAGGPLETTVVQAAAELAGGRVWPVHRLDRGTSGVLLLVTERDALQPWRDALAAGVKDYVAVVRGRTLAPITVRKPLADDRGHTRAALSELWPLVVAAQERVSLVAARIATGRTHQVRRHLAHANHPVCFDANHGDGRFNRALRERSSGPGLALHAISAQLRDPSDGVWLRLAAPPHWLPWASALLDADAVALALAHWLAPTDDPDDDSDGRIASDVAERRALGLASAQHVADSWPWPPLQLPRPTPPSGPSA